MKSYEPAIAYWDQVFEKVRPSNPKEILPQPELEDALAWLAKDASSVLDFGCGTGRYLFRLLQQGIPKGMGIDLSSEAVSRANELAMEFGCQEQAFFLNGSVRCLHEMNSSSFDGALLFNVVNHLLPDDALELIKQLHRLLAYRGRVLLKLNEYRDETTFNTESYEKIGDNFYIDNSGLYIWNLDHEAVDELLSPYFYIEQVVEVPYPHYETTERLYYLRVM